ncbi:MAG: Na+/H+ antiporter subunit E, partial [Woeseiaceae bacterium]|nr:Na+/H+ antiporter subunit E [Woeseiaceae bacterium]
RAGRAGAYLTLALLLIVAWVLWSGMFKPLLLGLGALSCVLVGYLAARMGYFDSRMFALRISHRLFGYWAWLFTEIVKSSLDVMRVVLARQLEVHTRVVEIDASDLDDVEQALLGNSITLTPGTLTLDITDGKLLVHALTPEGATGIEAGDMKRRVLALRGD